MSDSGLHNPGKELYLLSVGQSIADASSDSKRKKCQKVVETKKKLKNNSKAAKSVKASGRSLSVPKTSASSAMQAIEKAIANHPVIKYLHPKRNKPTRKTSSGPLISSLSLSDTSSCDEDKWTDVEDNRLRDAVLKYGHDWDKIVVFLAAGTNCRSRTAAECESRWTDAVCAMHKKGPWTSDEDHLVLELVSINGPRKWSTLAHFVPGRSGKQCRERWVNHLSPEVNKGEWTADEEKTLLDEHERLGNQWCKIAQALPGRSENAVKNRWNSFANRCLAHQTGKNGAGRGRGKGRGKKIVGDPMYDISSGFISQQDDEASDLYDGESSGDDQDYTRSGRHSQNTYSQGNYIATAEEIFENLRKTLTSHQSAPILDYQQTTSGDQNSTHTTYTLSSDFLGSLFGSATNIGHSRSRANASNNKSVPLLPRDLAFLQMDPVHLPAPIKATVIPPPPPPNTSSSSGASSSTMTSVHIASKPATSTSLLRLPSPGPPGAVQSSSQRSGARDTSEPPAKKFRAVGTAKGIKIDTTDLQDKPELLSISPLFTNGIGRLSPLALSPMLLSPLTSPNTPLRLGGNLNLWPLSPLNWANDPLFNFSSSGNGNAIASSANFDSPHAQGSTTTVQDKGKAASSPKMHSSSPCSSASTAFSSRSPTASGSFQKRHINTSRNASTASGGMSNAMPFAEKHFQLGSGGSRLNLRLEPVPRLLCSSTSGVVSTTSRSPVFSTSMHNPAARTTSDSTKHRLMTPPTSSGVSLELKSDTSWGGLNEGWPSLELNMLPSTSSSATPHDTRRRKRPTANATLVS